MQTVTKTLTPEMSVLLDAYWRAANYLSVTQIYLLGNPLLRRPLVPERHQAHAAGPSGDDSWSEFYLRALKPSHQKI